MIYDHPLVDQMYRHSPVLAQHALYSVYGLLQLVEHLTPTYRAYRAQLEASQWHSPEQLRALQEQRLQALIVHAYQNVPYYRRVFDERKLKPSDIRAPGDLYKLPVLTKLDLRRRQADLRARNIPARLTTRARSGGTTGVAVNFTLDKRQVVYDHALTDRHWAWAGFRPGDRVIVLRTNSRLFTGIQKAGHDFWRSDWARNRINLSSDRLTRAHMPQFADLLRHWQPKVITGFPWSIYAVASYLVSHGLVLPLQAVFTSSEVLAPAARQVIERGFACRVWDRYGTSERLAVGQQCEHGNYHQSVEFGLLQVDWPRGQPAAPGERGEIIQTGLTNLSMPIIRYASEDIGHLVSQPCPCGRGLPLMSPVDGRRADLIVTPDGRLISAASLAAFHATVPNAERCQLVQEQVGQVTLRVLPGPRFSAADSAELARRLAKSLGPGTRIRVEIADELTVTTNGKSRFVVSELDLDEITGMPISAAEGGPAGELPDERRVML